DKAAIARGKGALLIEVEDFQCPNANKLGEDVHLEMLREKIAESFVGVDAVGVGAGTVNELQRLGHNVIALISSEKPEDIYDGAVDDKGVKLVERFDNLRSQMWWTLRQDLEKRTADLCFPQDDELFEDLITPQWMSRNGKIIVQSKEEIRKKLGRSPNKGDAVVYWNWVRRKRRLEAAIGGASVRGDDEEEQEEEQSEAKRTVGYQPRYRDRRRRSF
ncbi:MAG: hypothetical protein MN733_36545, partial [Nitrososphaera sp.]|nr:hypothetical protein [Nitrososphaera sp.]